MRIRNLWWALALGLCIAASVYFFSTSAPDLTTPGRLVVPVRFCPLSGHPIMQINVGGSSYSLLIDLGSSHAIDLPKKTVDQLLDTTPLGRSDYFDLRGNCYPVHAVQVPLVTIQNALHFHNVPIYEEHPEFLTNSYLSHGLRSFLARFIEQWYIDGRVGYTLFQQLCCCFDFPHGTLQFARSMEAFSSEQWIQMPCSLERYGIVIAMDTDHGVKRLLLDTGSTRSVYRTHLVTSLQNLGPWEFLPFPISDQLPELDGILGVDFFKAHAICLDFKNKIAWIKQPSLK